MHNSDIERLASEALSYIDRCEYDGPDRRAVLPQADLPGLTRIIGKLLTLRPDSTLCVQPANVTDFAVLSAAVGSPDAADVASMAMHGWHVERLADVPALRAALTRLGNNGGTANACAAPKRETPMLHVDKDTACMSAADLAELHGVPKETLRKRLERWRQENSHGWIEDADRHGRSAQYLYEYGAVRHIINSLKRPLNVHRR